MILIKAYKIKWRILCAVIVGGSILFGFYYLASGIIQHRAAQSMSWAVANKIVVVDPGHGGPDGGGTGPSGILEKEVTLQFAKEVALKFSQAGSMVKLTREDDNDLSVEGKTIRQRKVEDLKNRVKLANEGGAAVYLSLHTNSFGSKWSGAQMFYYAESQESKRLAQCIQDEIVRIMGNTHRKPRPLDPYILRNLKMPAVIIEVGFLSNPQEEKLLLDTNYQSKMAYAIFTGTVKYFASAED